MSGIRCPMCDYDIYDCECEDRYGKKEEPKNEKPVLDVCCGSRMMWMDKADARAVFVDRRNEDYEHGPIKSYPSGKTISVRPDIVADFTNLPFPDGSFSHIVFDPPHIMRKAELGMVTQKYGCLNGDWETMLADGFRECFRVLKVEGTLIFKWCETQIPLSRILALTPEKPLYGHRSGKSSNTHWVAFLKQNARSMAAPACAPNFNQTAGSESPSDPC